MDHRFEEIFVPQKTNVFFGYLVVPVLDNLFQAVVSELFGGPDVAEVEADVGEAGNLVILVAKVAALIGPSGAGLPEFSRYIVRKPEKCTK
jgi:hypothetical protein